MLLAACSLLFTGLFLAQPTIPNGNFDTASSAFGTQHTWVSPKNNQDLFPAGTMTIGANPQTSHQFYLSFGDKSGLPTGKVLIVNALGLANSLVWSNYVGCLIPSRQYTLRAFGRSTF